MSASVRDLVLVSDYRPGSKMAHAGGAILGRGHALLIESTGQGNGARPCPRKSGLGSVHQGLLQCVHSVVVLLLEQACMRARARATTHQLAYGRKQGARSCKQLPYTESSNRIFKKFERL
jgi:hypothetical protein